ncbi:MAG: NAD(P)-binding protein [Lachnospiraceae bacterium]|nr:NAD(P)-binding protein [Lachnospiraceae bacterium]
MIRINQIKVPLTHTQEDLLGKAAKTLHIAKEEILSWQIVKKSIDARKKPEIYVIYVLEVSVKREEYILKHAKGSQFQRAENKKYIFPAPGNLPLTKRPVVIGTGPAGLFCGYLLAKHGYRPILLERGRDVENRRKDVETFWETGILNPDSNVQFGEGGAGTFSDGKLNTLVKDKYGRNKEVLRIFVEAGAPEEILYEAKPHIGTDVLMRVVKNMREQILSWGGEVRFESRVTKLVIENKIQEEIPQNPPNLSSRIIKGIIINDREQIDADVVVLAIGHSARDTFEMLYEHMIPMEAKAFAVGLRVEHPRKMINQIQYGMEESRYLPAASYKITAQTSNGRGVYSFCMCPGGYVVNASSENKRLAINGMSYSGRNGDNSNSAIIVTVTPEDYGDNSPLSGIAFQRSLEEKAYAIGQGSVPVETYGVFQKAVTGKQEKPSEILKKYPSFVPTIKGRYRQAPVHEILPEALQKSFVEGMEQFGRILPGFDDSGAYVSGIESRTSSPVRISRDETGQSEIAGLYPCGEGAGYAGGITSAAMDGMLIAEKIASVYYAE